MNDLFEFSEQFRLIRFQVANWGTFCGYHDIPISEKGHLFVGDSGSGKSTLLDAMSVLLVPRRYLKTSMPLLVRVKKAAAIVISCLMYAVPGAIVWMNTDPPS